MQSQGRIVLVQPYLSRIEAVGEVALIFISGAYSHSIHRGALLKAAANPDLATSLPLNVQRYEAPPQERSLAEQVMRHLPCDPGPDGKPLILEVELTEPALFLDFSDGGADRLADAFTAALGDRGEPAVILR